MATTVRVEVKGLRELGAQLKALSKDMQTKVARQAVSAGASVIKRIAKSKAPVSSPEMSPQVPPGYLRGSIIMRKQRRPDRRLTVQYAVSVRNKGKLVRSDVAIPYQIGIWNEFGTVKMAAQPFMRPAFDTGKGQALEAIRKRLLQRIEQANRAKTK